MTAILLFLFGALALAGLARGFVWVFFASVDLGERMGRRFSAYPVSWVWWYALGLAAALAVVGVCVMVLLRMDTVLVSLQWVALVLPLVSLASACTTACDARKAVGEVRP